AGINRGVDGIGIANCESRAVGNGNRARLEVGRAAGDIPAVTLIPAPGEIVAGVENVPRLGALNRYDGVELPAFQQLAKALDAGNGVSGSEGEAVPDVEVTVAVLSLGMGAVLRERPETIEGIAIEAVAVSVTSGERQAV